MSLAVFFKDKKLVSLNLKMGLPVDGALGRGFDDFTRDDLRDIILHKNKVIADLEEHAYGSASWIDNLNKGLKKANEIKGKVDKKPPKESEADFRKRLEDFDKERDAPSEEWGADELNGDGLFDDITAALPAYQKEKKDAYDKLPEAEKLKLETERKKSIAAKRAEMIKEAEQKAIKYLDEDKDKPYYEKSLKLKLGNLTREQYIQNFKDKRAKSFDEAKGGGPIQSILERRNRVQPLPLRPRTPPVFYTPPPPPPGPSIYGTPVYSSNPAAATAAASAAAPSPALPGAPMLSARIQPALGAPAPPPPAAGVPQPPPPPQLSYDFDCPPQYTTII